MTDIIDEEKWLEEDEPAENKRSSDYWRILIVDDEPDIHAVTRLALNKLTYKGRELEILSAYSGIEAYDLLVKEDNIGMILLDVVMETEDAGLLLAKRIREELHNDLVRIILRTGQPGQAPEQSVIVDYDINDYKLKTELTAQKMFTTVISSLRAYEGLKTIETNRRGLDKILEAASNLYQLDSLKELASGVLTQISAILNFGTDGVLCVMGSSPDNDIRLPLVIATTGKSTELLSQKTLRAEHPWTANILQAFEEKKSLFSDELDVLLIQAAHGHQFAVAFKPLWPLNKLEISLLNIFCDRIAAAFDNLHMFELLKATQEATVVVLADLAESRDATTGGHVRRVCRLTDAIAMELKAANKLPPEVDANFLAFVGIASILHDVGKVGIPDNVLLKPGKHTPEERTIMEGHAQIGETVLARAARMVEGESSLSIGAQIAGSHHEHYDGSGYPRRLKGAEIPFAARIVAVVDVFDALLHARPYKQAWPLDDVIAYLEERSGKQFDPDVVWAIVNFIKTKNPDWIISEGH
ncbi:DUF3369 domain-containing protein [Undibacterium sp. SXout20W]|uniref:DUF3369 domain-containing protein n=1 Tax=Undibacterium sp. SXout20W TaxID=3413051 RepID=UPI003BF34358